MHVLCIGVNAYMYVRVPHSHHKVQKNALHLLELEWQVVVSHLLALCFGVRVSLCGQSDLELLILLPLSIGITSLCCHAWP